MKPLLEARELTKVFSMGRKTGLEAVSRVSLEIREGEVLGLVGESGCGKTTLGRMLIRRLAPSSGELFFRGRKISDLPEKDFHPLRREMQMVFQDPYASLDPRMTVLDLIGEPLAAWHVCGGRGEMKRKVLELMEAVGIPEEDLYAYPHQFSGGERQRIGIARAIALNPALIVCDEPVSALDVSVQNQILNLMKSLQKERGMSMVFISHDLSVIRCMAGRTAVMYQGKICEMAGSGDLFRHPLHPYTRLLVRSVPEPEPEKRQRRESLADPGAGLRPERGCPFHPRCPFALEVCREKPPCLRDAGGRQVACHRAEEMENA